MRDPLEGVTEAGGIRTGVDRRRLPPPLRPVVDAVVDAVRSQHPSASVYVYGSAATGQAQVPTSDLDVLTVDLPAERASAIAAELSSRFRARCRAVELAPATSADLAGDGDEAYGARVFLHHYCVHVAGPDHDRATAAFPADRRAARGFNGDLGRHARRWRQELDVVEPAALGRRVARKALLAVAGLVSVRGATWTTDRVQAARTWSRTEPHRRDDAARLLAWSEGRARAGREELEVVLAAAVDPLVETFAEEIGLWDGEAASL